MNTKPLLITHSQCGFPLELCICVEGDCFKRLTPVQCVSCAEKWVAVSPPGIPVCDFRCPECDEKGTCVEG